MGFSFLRAFLTLSIIYVFAIASSTAQAQTFRCTSTGRKCNALIDFVSPNATTLSAIRTLFGVRNLRTLLGANNFPLSTPSNRSVSARQIIKIPFPCMCTNGTGISNRRPNYTVVPDDTLSGIAEKVFAGLVTFQQIQNVNNIPNPDLILVGQVLWIPLPCSCDDVHEERVVHYGHMVASGSTVDGLAQQYNTSAQTLLTLNELASPNDLKANVPFDVPLKACTSRIVNISKDYPLLVSNGTYVFTATNCVMCNCDAANNWTLQCRPSPVNSSCLGMQCQGTDNLYIGNTTSTSCNRSTCAYAGYSNQAIITTLDTVSTCPVPDNSSLKLSLGGWNWNILLISVHLVLFCLHFLE